MPAHWTGSVFLSVLSIAAAVTSARSAWRSAWREAACWATAAAGGSYLAAQNAGIVDQGLPGGLLMSAFMLQKLLLLRTGQTNSA